MVAKVETAGKVDKVANVATVVKAVTTGAMEKVAKAAQYFDLMISYHFYAFCGVIASTVRRTAATAVKVETAAKAVSAFRSYYIISLLRILRRERYVFAHNAW